jgi:glyoxylase-like metal-dependent hydrolase (beta-lactamase superfamily II)
MIDASWRLEVPMSAMDGTEDSAKAEARHSKARLGYPFASAPEAGATLDVAPGVKWVRMPLPFALQWINLWLIADGDGWALVDTGLGSEVTREHWRKIFEESLGGAPITRVIITHMHPDHIGLAGWITRKFDCRLWISRLEYVTCRMLVADTGREAPADGERFYRAAGWDEDALDSYRVRFGGFGKMVSRLPDSYVRMRDGDVLSIGGRPWQVICGNGHSPEHACLWQEDLKLLISGDQVLPRITSNVSVFPTEPEADPLSDWLDSCSKLKAALPADLLTLPAHNEPFTGLHDRLQDLIDGHERALARIESRLKQAPRRAVDIFGALFARPIGPDVIGMATGESIAHLNCLVSRGRAKRTTDETGMTVYVAA